ncbi:hypothetical protein BV22DRAFT_1030223 [Leucogyrophana mollusca]|uniref:Uncharacterized protein n=1 Tax=Leucogyrophana mollusca TaxID=85980 RepID=A0ACB8BTT5_9AGAM|nr:hypothetical protein BV22DRAFT_1030223 [Leucogyrophana mollusca]
MFYKATLTVLLAAAATAFAASAEVQWYTTRSCAGGSALDYRGVACNSCQDPALDWYAVEVTGIDSSQQVTVHNEDGCTSASVVAQQYGDVCIVAGATALRSVYVSC